MNNARACIWPIRTVPRKLVRVCYHFEGFSKLYKLQFVAQAIQIKSSFGQFKNPENLGIQPNHMIWFVNHYLWRMTDVDWMNRDTKFMMIIYWLPWSHLLVATRWSTSNCSYIRLRYLNNLTIKNESYFMHFLYEQNEECINLKNLTKT